MAADTSVVRVHKSNFHRLGSVCIVWKPGPKPAKVHLAVTAIGIPRIKPAGCKVNTPAGTRRVARLTTICLFISRLLAQSSAIYCQ